MWLFCQPPSTLQNLLNILSWDFLQVLKLRHCCLELLICHMRAAKESSHLNFVVEGLTAKNRSLVWLFILKNIKHSQWKGLPLVLKENNCKQLSSSESILTLTKRNFLTTKCLVLSLAGTQKLRRSQVKSRESATTYLAACRELSQDQTPQRRNEFSSNFLEVWVQSLQIICRQALKYFALNEFSQQLFSKF